ncbi:MAG: VanW family protein [Lachnospirales bacterium]
MKTKKNYSFLILFLILLTVMSFSFNVYGQSIKISEFSTPLGNSDYSRIYNINRANRTLSNTIVMPNQTFSFNSTIGNASIKNGYKASKVVVYDKLVDGEGGGVCQVSTTLFNAVDKGNFPIIERHSHTRDIPYIEDGRDATIAYGTKDFKFTNDRSYPIRIKSYTKDNNLLVEIYSI